MKQSAFRSLVLGAFACVLAGAGTPTASHAAEVEVKIDNFVFSPAELKIKKGDTVTWANLDDIPHTVVSQPIGTFRSRPLDTDQKYSFKFDQTGTYEYFCSLHPHMKARIIVED